MEDPVPDNISKAPVNILFSPSSMAKKDVWEVDLIQILDMLTAILERSGTTDLKVAGMAALSSSLIYRMKVESIFALQKAAAGKAPARRRTDADIEMIGIPYRHEPTYPVTLENLLDLLQNLIGTIANPKSRSRRLEVEPMDVPTLEEYLIPIEETLRKYEDLIGRKIRDAGFGIFRDITAGLDKLDSVRCFFAILFMARDGKVDLEQVGDDIRVTARGGTGADPVRESDHAQSD